MNGATPGGPLQAALVEAFTKAPLGGNGAGVVLLREPAAPGWMQALAARLQQSETAFLWSDPAGDWRLRWFTPSCEVPLCGHATLAAVIALGHWGQLAAGQELALHSLSGPLAVCLESLRPASARIVLPNEGLVPEPTPPYLAQLLGDSPLAYWSSPLGYRVALMADSFDLAGLPLPSGQLRGQDRQGLVVMQAFGLSQPDAADQPEPAPRPQVLAQPATYQLRFFAPGLGIAEDPVTGSAHALVAPYWQERLGQGSVVGWQPSPSPGGMVCTAAADGRIALTGRGHLLWDGSLEGGSCAPDPANWSVCGP
jgi:predicted PhzF superfamily epimerase YddE/YHI9